MNIRFMKFKFVQARYTLLLAVVLSAPSAYSASVYLECTTLNEYSGTTTHYTITLDEQAQTATFTNDGIALDETITRPAQFSQSEVLFTYVVVGFPLNYKIDRVTLELTQTSGADESKVDRGLCTVSAPIDRAF